MPVYNSLEILVVWILSQPSVNDLLVVDNSKYNISVQVIMQILMQIDFPQVKLHTRTFCSIPSMRRGKGSCICQNYLEEVE